MNSTLHICAVIAIALGSGCAAHVQLTPPPTRGAPLEERRAFYEAHRPVSVKVADGSGRPLGPTTLTLANGTRVAYAEDLLVHVDGDSVTAQAVARAKDAELTSAVVSSVLISGVTVLGGLNLGFSLSAFANDTKVPEPLILATSVGSALLPVIVFAGVTFLMPVQWAAQRERETALLTYDRSLRQRLALSPAQIAAVPPVTEAAPVVVDDGPPRARLTFGVLPSGCFDVERFRAAVHESIGRDPFVADAEDEVHVEVVEREGEMVLALELRHAGKLVGRRELNGADCGELTARAALVLSVLLEPLP